ncbi:unnamed protein product [Lymnaea stagnalis]|uniref:Uncharacterized protein n=1 Tax=Lymnaea stagnalis TaxID=6523 RepID=A0AAV2IHL8_LYMST
MSTLKPSLKMGKNLGTTGVSGAVRQSLFCHVSDSLWVWAMSGDSHIWLTKTVEAWAAAAGQMFFSLSVSFGGIIMFGSYNKFNNKVYG